MSREEFFYRLNAAMAGLPVNEINRVNEYYAEYWDDALEAGKSEREVAESLDPPEIIAGKVRHEFSPSFAKAEDAPKSGGKTALIIVLAIFAGPLAIGLLGALIGLLCAGLGVAVGFAAVILALLAAGIALAASAFALMAVSPIGGLLMLGAGLIVVGFGLLGGLGFAALIKATAALCGKALGYARSKKTLKTGRSASA